MKKIIMTGATGFIGRNLLKSLMEKYNITVLVQFESDISKLPDEVKSIVYNKNNVSNIDRLFSIDEYDGIIHLASLFLKDHNLNQIPELIESNILLGTQILDIAAQHNVKWFINTGTFWQHYNNEEYNPVNLYAATKQAFEDIAKYYIETSKIKFVTLKLNDTFGPNDTRPKIFNLWDKIAKTGETLDMSPGDQIIDISYIDDIVAAYERLIEIFENGEIDINGKSFALYSDNRLTLKELACLYEKITNRELNINWGGRPYREREVMIPWENGEKIPGYRQNITVEEGIRRFVNE
jgi:nucleoside-diphosphate-sugar epimerase